MPSEIREQSGATAFWGFGDQRVVVGEKMKLCK